MPLIEEPRAFLADSPEDRQQVQDLYLKIQSSHVNLVGPDGRTESLPRSLQDFLVKLIGCLRTGQPIAIVQNDAQYTTVEAAQILGVSRQFLIKVLERDEIPHHMVGTHRRIYVRDLLAYKAKRDGKRRQILDELTHAEAEDGLYDLEPLDDRRE